ncbi:VCBS repeat-containing protein [Streptomyces morookaense]|uniref:FG-GAP repeat domain-containing protein n=1 Tax=Streptomyces morookaense TaxID=1970 RepID=UPI0033FD0B5A
MATISGRKGTRALSRFVTAAIAAALIGTTAGTAVADSPAPAPAAKALRDAAVAAKPQAAPRAALAAATAAAPALPLFTADKDGFAYMYELNGHGGFKDRLPIGTGGWDSINAATQVHDQNGQRDGWYVRATDGTLIYTGKRGNKTIGGGWNVYDRIFSPGDLGGASDSDVLARDKSGVLWVYLSYPDGTLSDRFRVGPGWDQYTDIVGRGDLNGDGITDIVAKDRNGDLWFYKGTGDYHDPFKSRVQVGGGWDQYDTLVATGDVDGDGRSDLLARDKASNLWLYKGNGNQRDPFENRTRIGGGWDQYRLMF